MPTCDSFLVLYLDRSFQEQYLLCQCFEKKPNLEHIVQQLYQCEGSQVPTIQNKETALKCLQNLIEAKGEHPLLLVLDDVCPGSESLVQKLNEIKRPNYKILVTSRFDFPGLDCSYPFHCKVLDNESAMELFRLSLGDSSFPIDLAIKVILSLQMYLTDMLVYANYELDLKIIIIINSRLVTNPFSYLHIHRVIDFT